MNRKTADKSPIERSNILDVGVVLHDLARHPKQQGGSPSQLTHWEKRVARHDYEIIWKRRRLDEIHTSRSDEGAVDVAMRLLSVGYKRSANLLQGGLH